MLTESKINLKVTYKDTNQFDGLLNVKIMK